MHSAKVIPPRSLTGTYRLRHTTSLIDPDGHAVYMKDSGTSLRGGDASASSYYRFKVANNLLPVPGRTTERELRDIAWNTLRTGATPIVAAVAVVPSVRLVSAALAVVRAAPAVVVAAAKAAASRTVDVAAATRYAGPAAGCAVGGCDALRWGGNVLLDLAAGTPATHSGGAGTVDDLARWRSTASRPGGGAAGVAPVDIYLNQTRYPQAAQHAIDAQQAGQPVVLTIDRAGAEARRAQALRDHPVANGLDRDKYPPAMFVEGGSGGSVRYIDPGDNRGAGSSLGHQCRALGSGALVRIIVRCD